MKRIEEYDHLQICEQMRDYVERCTTPPAESQERPAFYRITLLVALLLLFAPLLQRRIVLETIPDENAHVHFDGVPVEGEPPPAPPTPEPLPAGWVQRVSEDFEDGEASWSLPAGGQVNHEDGNAVLEGATGSKEVVIPFTSTFTDMAIRGRFTVQNAQAGLVFRRGRRSAEVRIT